MSKYCFVNKSWKNHMVLDASLKSTHHLGLLHLKRECMDPGSQEVTLQNLIIYF